MQYSVVNYKMVKENSDFRIDADYFRLDFLNSLKLITSHENLMLSEISNVNGGKRLPLGENFSDSDNGVSYIRAEDVKNGFVQYENSPKISLKLHEFLKRYQTKKEDILITIVGNSIGDVGIVKFDLKKCNLTENCAKVTNLEKVIPEFLFTFLLSKHGQIQIHREKVGTAQPKLALERIRKFKIPIFSAKFQNNFSIIVNQANQFIDNSKSLYSQAEQLLLSELGLSDWKPKHELSFVKNFSETQKAERMDAEYFQPFYEEVESKLSMFEQKTLDELCSEINYGTVPTSPYVEVGIPYIKGLNLIEGLIGGKIDRIKNTDSLSQKYYTKENDIVISQMGTVGKAGLVSKKEEGCLFASFTIRVRLAGYDFVDPYILTLFINKIARPYYLMRKIAQASVRQNTDLPTIKSLRVPKLGDKIQQTIRDNIIESRELKHLSKSLLEIAKQGVEMAIEKDEKEAENWINGEIEKFDISI